MRNGLKTLGLVLVLWTWFLLQLHSCQASKRQRAEAQTTKQTSFRSQISNLENHNRGMAHYEFVTIWKVRAPRQQVWDLIFNSEQWPNWWPGVEKVEKLRDGGANHAGAIFRYTWKSKLPYRLVFEMETTRVEPISIIEGRAIGELQGEGRWTISQENEITTARYDWKVETTKAWMNLLAPVARPFFNWNHDVVMGWGGEGLAKQLGVDLSS